MKIFQLVTTIFLLGLFQTLAMCQTTSTTPSIHEARTSADETFELNISERRITRENYSASTSLSTDKSRLDLRIGVGITAGKIEVLLRNVQGRVHFSGNLDRIMRLLEIRETVPPRPAP